MVLIETWIYLNYQSVRKKCVDAPVVLAHGGYFFCVMNSFEDILPKLCVVLAFIALFMFFVFCSIENVTQILKQRKQHSSIRFTNFLSAAINNYLFLAYGCNQRHVFFDSKTNQQKTSKFWISKSLFVHLQWLQCSVQVYYGRMDSITHKQQAIDRIPLNSSCVAARKRHDLKITAT